MSRWTQGLVALTLTGVLSCRGNDSDDTDSVGCDEYELVFTGVDVGYHATVYRGRTPLELTSLELRVDGSSVAAVAGSPFVFAGVPLLDLRRAAWRATHRRARGGVETVPSDGSMCLADEARSDASLSTPTSLDADEVGWVEVAAQCVGGASCQALQLEVACGGCVDSVSPSDDCASLLSPEPSSGSPGVLALPSSEVDHRVAVRGTRDFSVRLTKVGDLGEEVACEEVRVVGRGVLAPAGFVPTREPELLSFQAGAHTSWRRCVLTTNPADARVLDVRMVFPACGGARTPPGTWDLAGLAPPACLPYAPQVGVTFEINTPDVTAEGTASLACTDSQSHVTTASWTVAAGEPEGPTLTCGDLALRTGGSTGCSGEGWSSGDVTIYGTNALIDNSTGVDVRIPNGNGEILFSVNPVGDGLMAITAAQGTTTRTVQMRAIAPLTLIADTTSLAPGGTATLDVTTSAPSGATCSADDVLGWALTAGQPGTWTVALAADAPEEPEQFVVNCVDLDVGWEGQLEFTKATDE